MKNSYELTGVFFGVFIFLLARWAFDVHVIAAVVITIVCQLGFVTTCRVQEKAKEEGE